MADWFETRFRQPIDAGQPDPAFIARMRALVVEEWQADAGTIPPGNDDDTDTHDREGDIVMLETEDHPTRHRPGTPRRRPRGGWLLAAAAVAVVAIVGALLIAAAADGTDPIDTVDSPTTTPTTAASEPEGPVATAGFTKYDAGGETWASVGIVISTSTHTGAVELTVTLLDAAGSPVATQTGYVAAVVPMGEVYAAVQFVGSDVSAAETVRVDVTNVSGSRDADPITVIVERFAFDGATGRFELAGSASNPTGEPVESGRIQCVAWAATVPVAGFSVVTDTIAPGATIAWDGADAFDPGADEVTCSGTG